MLGFIRKRRGFSPTYPSEIMGWAERKRSPTAKTRENRRRIAGNKGRAFSVFLHHVAATPDCIGLLPQQFGTSQPACERGWAMVEIPDLPEPTTTAREEQAHDE
jgi:hypothetical protein